MRFLYKTSSWIFLIIIFSLILITALSAALFIPKSDIIFSHKKHSDLSCFDCHNTIEESDKSEDKNLPNMDICTQCHDGEVLPGECATCHVNEDDPQALINPRRDFVFSHKRHKKRETECFLCHGEVDKKGRLTSENIADMGKCYECHEGFIAQNYCELCHVEMNLKKYHLDDWKHDHQFQASIKKEKCIQCHQNEDLCQKCHQGDNLFQMTHPLNYQYTHGLDARFKESDCLSCHLTREFCNNCHSNESGKPFNHSDLEWGLSGKHGEFAKKDMEFCASCHDRADPVCTWCHQDKTAGKGNDHNIHPTGFASSLGKGPWHEDDGYFCYECHTREISAFGGFCGYCHGSKRN